MKFLSVILAFSLCMPNNVVNGSELTSGKTSNIALGENKLKLDGLIINLKLSNEKIELIKLFDFNSNIDYREKIRRWSDEKCKKIWIRIILNRKDDKISVVSSAFPYGFQNEQYKKLRNLIDNDCSIMSQLYNFFQFCDKNNLLKFNRSFNFIINLDKKHLDKAPSFFIVDGKELKYSDYSKKELNDLSKYFISLIPDFVFE